MAHERFWRALSGAEGPAAAAVLLDLLDAGAAPEEIVRDVVAPAMARVGDLWAAGQWSVADEHAATAAVETAVAALLARLPPPTGPRLAMLCPDGEWHALPLRLAALVARAQGVDALVLGASLPTPVLERWLQAAPVDGVGLSCTLPSNLLAARRGIEAAAAAGLPVLVGGQAWGGVPARAARLGARLAEAGADLATELRAAAACAGPDPAPPEVDRVAELPDAVLHLVLDRHAAADRRVARLSPWQRERAVEDLRRVCRYTAAALLCGDGRVLDDLLVWLTDLHAARGVPADLLGDGCRLLVEALEPEAPTAAALLAERTAHLVGAGPAPPL